MAGDENTKSTGAIRASEMQLQTRRTRHFDEVEAALPNPKLAPPSIFSAAGLSATNLLSHLGRRNPFAKPVTDKDVVWLFDNTAFKPTRFGSWQAEFVAAVFEQEPKCSIADVVANVAKQVGLADDEDAMKTIEERLMPFLWDIRPGCQIRAIQEGKELKLGPTGPNGVSSDVLKVPSSESGTLVQTSGAVPRGTQGLLDMRTFFADPDGWGIISGEHYFPLGSD
jgi:hypothetical protein